MKHFNLNNFINQYITEREESLFSEDLRNHHAQLAHEINDKRVLVIGGAGTIGSSYIKALLQFRPSALYVVDTNENGLTELTRDLRSSVGMYIPDEYKPYPINFGEPVFAKILQEKGPFDIVANFAAHKHVRSEKDPCSIEAMIRNNVFLAKHLLDQLAENPPAHFFCVSTDKAANPVNVMGASKKLMEEVILSYSNDIPITTARFANVAFSNGSLLYGFLERMMKQQPLSAPSDVKRYFVSPEESGQLCLLACILGESKDIFFPKLKEEQMKTFAAIAEDFLKAYGRYRPGYCETEEEARQKALNFDPNSDRYPVYFFKTDTSGEKSYEEFYTGKEKIDWKSFEQLGVIKDTEVVSKEKVKGQIKKLQTLFARQGTVKKFEIVEVLNELIPDFRHIETGKSLDQKM